RGAVARGGEVGVAFVGWGVLATLGSGPEPPDPYSTAARPRTAGRAGWCWLLGLQRPHVGGLGALWARRHVELDDLPLIKRAVASRLDRAEMHEDVLAGLRGDEAKALLGVEPLHGSNRHILVLPPSSRRYQATPATARIRRWVEVLLPTPAPKSEA